MKLLDEVAGEFMKRRGRELRGTRVLHAEFGGFAGGFWFRHSWDLKRNIRTLCKTGTESSA